MPGLALALLLLCSCEEGFLDSIKQKIRRDDAPPAKLFWTNTGNSILQRSDLDGTNVETIVDDPAYVQNPYAVAVDAVNYKVYWSTLIPLAINRANFDGSGIVRVVSAGLGSVVTGLAVDPQAGVLCFCTQSAVYRFPLSAGTQDATAYQLTINTIYDFVTPEIAGLNATATRFFWTDLGGGGAAGVYRQDFSSGNSHGIMRTNCVDPRDVALSQNGDLMYWTDSGTGNLYSSSTANPDDDANNYVIIDGSGQPYGISLDFIAGRIYWTDVFADAIYRSALDGSGVTPLPIVGLNNPYDVAVFRLE